MGLYFYIIFCQCKCLAYAEGERKNYSLSLASPCFSWHHCRQKTQRGNSFFCLTIPFASPKPLPTSTSVTEKQSARKRFRNPQTKWLKYSELSSLTAPKRRNKRLAQQRSFTIYTDLRSETSSCITGKQKRFSRSKDQYHGNHYD